MMLSRITSINRYNEILTCYKRKDGKNNDYLQRDIENLIATGLISEYCDESNAYLFVKKTIGYRLYYYLNDFTQIPDFNDVQDVVVEILYRGEEFYPTREIEFFRQSGFNINLIRDQYSGVYKDFSDINTTCCGFTVSYAETVADVKAACELFNATFDVLSGDYISEDEYNGLLASDSIFIAKDSDGNFLGALHQSFAGKVAVLSHIAVNPSARGRYIGKALLDKFIDANKAEGNGRFQLWVQQQNEAAVNMYRKKGFKYAAKSTISLIK